MANRDVLWAQGHDETVEVNQRALIDKVLARYSGEFTVFRELLQNSDDASARSVEIRFETDAYLARQKRAAEGTNDAGVEAGSSGTAKQKLPDLKTAQVHQWTFKNNGVTFRDEDWSRLKKIAEGNPDEEKIGAFGVGFYSLFSVTEEPWVTSGGQWMGFYWKDKKDQLFARRGQLPAAEGSSPDPWTTFQMTLREPAPIPAAFDFTRFLVSSITFMAHLSEVSVYFDDKRLVRITKDAGTPKDIAMIKGLKPASPKGLMTVKSIQTTPLDIQADVVRWVYEVGTEKPSQIKTIKAAAQASGGFFSSLLSGFSIPQRSPTPQQPLALAPAVEIDMMEVSSSSVRLTIFSANVEVKLDRKLSGELQRSTKKNPPSKLKYELIYTGKSEYDASIKEEEKSKFATGSVFQGLRADLDGSGAARIFIGHSTGQTTGIGGHMATRFIPTVERESIDLVDRHVAVWNKELLYIGGFLSRSGYEREMASIKEKWEQSAAADGPGGKPDPEIQKWLRDQALHAMKFYTFHASTPSSLVSAEMEAAFFACAHNHPFPVMSSEGIRDARTVRSMDATFATFLKRLPTLPDDVVNGAPTLVAALRRQRMVIEIVFDDILAELQARPLDEAEAVACLKWWASQQKVGRAPPSERARLLNALIVSLGGPSGSIISLSSIQTFLNAKKTGAIIPTDGPLPDHLLPAAISRHFDPDLLATTFPWKEFGVFDWLKHILNPAVASRDPTYDITLSPQWAERMLQVLTRGWPNLPKIQQQEAVSYIKSKACIPTSAGLKIPDQAYFASVSLFRDLPIITLPSGQPIKKDMEKVLHALGVRKHVELQMVFDRMIKTGDWTVVDLVKYLVSVESTLHGEELQRLKQTSAFTKEDNSISPSKPGTKRSRFKAKDLYEPIDALRELKLPILDWGTEYRWKPASDEAKFLFSLGLNRVPPLKDLLELAAGTDAEVRPKALRYFINNFEKYTSSYDPHDFKDLAFIPALGKMGSHLAKPLEVFASPDWSPLGFAIIAPDWKEHAQTKFKIREHPPTSRLVYLLETNPPPDHTAAAKWFEILSGRIPEFSNSERDKLSSLRFVPTKLGTGEKATTTYMGPNQCYFAGSGTADFHSKIFVFINFGSRANSFLAFCGTKQEPSVEEIAQILLADPRKFFELAGSRQNYQHELKNFAVNARSITHPTLTRMKRSAILVGSRRARRKSEKTKLVEIDGDEEDWDYEYELLRPDQIVIADDANSYQLFGDSVYSAPQDDLLEGFYLSLGSIRLSVLVKEEYTSAKEILNAKEAAKIRHLILERLPLFLHEHSQSKMKVSLSWLQGEKNFVVRSFGKLGVTRSIHFGNVSVSRPVEASAVARWDRRVLQLWLATNTEVDMYEVSTSMCRTMFDSPKASEVLLFMTILSTDLRSLMRRGYNVDRILRRQKEEREQAEKSAQAEREKLAAVQKNTLSKENGGTLLEDMPNPLRPTTGTAAPIPNNTLPLPPTGATSLPPEKAASPPPTQPVLPTQQSNINSLLRAGTSALQSAKHRLSTKLDGQTPRSSQSGAGLLPRPDPGSVPDWSKPQSSSGNLVTPLSNIDANVMTAIRACSEEKSDVLRTRQQMAMVKETENEGYCDVSGRAEALDAIGNVGDMRVYLSPDVPDGTTFLSRKQNELQRFINITHVLCDVFELSRKTVHIFSDQTGPLIAFNRNGSLFVNFRYYEAWHDDDVKKGDKSQAFISWYFSLAHEIAHNLVQPHNSEHEFYFSYICEKYLTKLMKLTASST